jgi:hypothetical protein
MSLKNDNYTIGNRNRYLPCSAVPPPTVPPVNEQYCLLYSSYGIFLHICSYHALQDIHIHHTLLLECSLYFIHIWLMFSPWRWFFKNRNKGFFNVSSVKLHAAILCILLVTVLHTHSMQGYECHKNFRGIYLHTLLVLYNDKSWPLMISAIWEQLHPFRAAARFYEQDIKLMYSPQINVIMNVLEARQNEETNAVSTMRILEKQSDETRKFEL